MAFIVVYLLNPTSNHNSWSERIKSIQLYIFWILHQTTTNKYLTKKTNMLYIFWILHQTTTLSLSALDLICCISFESYIKPQPEARKADEEAVVYLLNPTSNHNYWLSLSLCLFVVYLLNPTSNHNIVSIGRFCAMLYIFWILHQTTTDRMSKAQMDSLYIFWILHQTTTLYLVCLLLLCCISFESYIKPQHFYRVANWEDSCISFESYIKPQP